jgi:dTDP-4-dehydrorhamnose reductase
MKVLITGSNGLLGQHLVKLMSPTYELIATSRGENRLQNKSGYTYREMDITEEEAVKNVLLEIRPDAIIHCAAMTHVDQCELNPKDCRLMNVTAVDYLLKYSKEFNPHFVHLSTDFVFDGENGPYKETDEVNPLSVYAQSKLDSEILVQNSGLKWAIARTIIIYGIADDMSRSNIVLWAKGALEKGDPIKVVNDQYRMPTYVGDLAKGCELIVKKKAQGIYHLSGKDFMRIDEIVKRVADFYKLDTSKMSLISSESLAQAAKRPPKTGFIIDKAVNELAYAPLSFEEGLAQLNL